MKKQITELKLEQIKTVVGGLGAAASATTVKPSAVGRVLVA